MAIPETIHSQTHPEADFSATDNVIERHPQSGHPAKAAPGGEHHPGLAGFSTCGWCVHLHPAGWPAGYQSGISPRTTAISSTVGGFQFFSTDQRIAVKLSGLDQLPDVLFYYQNYS